MQIQGGRGLDARPASVRERQQASRGNGSGNRPADAFAYPASNWVHVSLAWNVPANACSGVTRSSRNRGSRRSTVFTLTCAPHARDVLRLSEQASQDWPG